MDKTLEENREMANTRYRVYSFLAKLLLQNPEKQSITDNLKVMEDILKALKQVPLSIDQEAYRFQRGSALCEQEYYDCFFVPKSGRYVPPYESALRQYKPQEKKNKFAFLDPNCSAHAAECYALAQFDPKKMNVFAPLKELDIYDHLGFELAFMAFLSKMEEKAAFEKDKAIREKWHKYQELFLRCHLNSALGNFAQGLSDAQAPYYAQSALVMRHWVEHDNLNLVGTSDTEQL